MNKALALALLVVGAVLFILGLDASESISSEISEAVTGAPTDRSIWLIALGLAGVIVGGVGLWRRRA